MSPSCRAISQQCKVHKPCRYFATLGAPADILVCSFHNSMLQTRPVHPPSLRQMENVFSTHRSIVYHPPSINHPPVYARTVALASEAYSAIARNSVKQGCGQGSICRVIVGVSVSLDISSFNMTTRQHPQMPTRQVSRQCCAAAKP